MKDNFGLRSSLFTSKEELLSMKSHKMLALRRIICLYNIGDEQQKRLTVIIVLFLLCFCFSISSIDMISISSNSATTLQVKDVAKLRSIFLQGVRESIKIAHSIADSIVFASLYYINPSNSQSLKLSFKIIYQMARTKSKFNVNPTTNTQANQ